MRLVHVTVVAVFTAGSALVGAPSAGAAVPGTVTVCAKGLPKGSEPVSVEVGFMHDEVVEARPYPLTRKRCVTVGDIPAPSGVWVDADRRAKRIVVKTPSGKTHVKKSDRADFSLSSGDNVTVTLWFGAR